MHLICKTCQSVLANDLTPVIYASRSEVLGKNMVASGTVTTEDGSFFRNRVGSYITHTDDIENVVLTSDPKRLNGCCGLDGLDGHNLVCRVCGMFIATKMTDCWMPHCILFDEETTRFEE